MLLVLWIISGACFSCLFFYYCFLLPGVCSSDLERGLTANSSSTYISSSDSSSSSSRGSSAASSTDVSMLSKSSWLSADRSATTTAQAETSSGEYESRDFSIGSSRSRLVQSLLFPSRSVKARAGARHQQHCAPSGLNVFSTEQIYLDMNSRTLPSQFSYCTLRNFK